MTEAMLCKYMGEHKPPAKDISQSSCHSVLEKSCQDTGIQQSAIG